MKRPKTLYKTKIVIWSEFDPNGNMELDELARDAMVGESYCSEQSTTKVDDVDNDDDWDGTEFFGEEPE